MKDRQLRELYNLTSMALQYAADARRVATSDYYAAIDHAMRELNVLLEEMEEVLGEDE